MEWFWNGMIIQEPEFPIIGKQAFVTRQQPNLDEVCRRYGRDSSKMCIKVFYGNPIKDGQTLKEALWGDNPPKNEPRKNTTVFAGAQVQNILWKHNLSPRVYAMFEAEFRGNRVACHLTDFIEGKSGETGDARKMWNLTEEVGKEYGFTAQSMKMGPNDVVGGKNVDPQLWAWDKQSYLEVVKKIYIEKGRYGKVYYQNDEELGLFGGPRDSKERVKIMKLDEIDFKDKVVWDLGCNEGYFCRYADKRRAKRVIGFDVKDQLEAAFHAGNLLGNFNIDYVECDLSKGVPNNIPKPDIALFLSLNFHIGIPEYLKDMKSIVFEDNGEESKLKDSLGEPWTKWFKKIKFIGRSKDQGNCLKPVYWLWN